VPGVKMNGECENWKIGKLENVEIKSPARENFDYMKPYFL
jgi:hypothetical protein